MLDQNRNKLKCWRKEIVTLKRRNENLGEIFWIKTEIMKMKPKKFKILKMKSISYEVKERLSRDLITQKILGIHATGSRYSNLTCII